MSDHQHDCAYLSWSVISAVFRYSENKMHGLCLVLLLHLLDQVVAKDCQTLLAHSTTPAPDESSSDDKRESNFLELPKEIKELLPHDAEETANCRFDLLNLNGQEALIKQLADARYKFCLGCGHVNDANQCHSVEVCDDHAVCINGSHAHSLGGLLQGYDVNTEPWHGCCRPDKSEKKCKTRDETFTIHEPIVTAFGIPITYHVKTCDGPLCNAGDQYPDKIRIFRLAITDPTALHSWNSWNSWSGCNCTTKHDTRSRTCKGFDCLGSEFETRQCANATACPINGGWSNFTDWSACEATCGGGNQSRVRFCINPVPANGGTDCIGDKREIRSCNTQSCPAWGTWSSWKDCSEINGQCWRTRLRQCSTGYESDCRGETADVQLCGMNECHHESVDGGWSSWSDWYTCSATCGNGSQIHVRHCNNPAPSWGGKQCVGPAKEARPCNTNVCPYWLPWGPLSECQSVKEICLSYRVRNCSTGHQNDCGGGDSEVVPCKQDKCGPKWSAWSVPLACELHDGLCITTVTRTCSTGRQADCIGKHYHVFPCASLCCDPSYNGTSCGLPFTFNTSMITSQSTNNPPVSTALNSSTLPSVQSGTVSTNLTSSLITDTVSATTLPFTASKMASSTVKISKSTTTPVITTNKGVSLTSSVTTINLSASGIGSTSSKHDMETIPITSTTSNIPDMSTIKTAMTQTRAVNSSVLAANMNATSSTLVAKVFTKTTVTVSNMLSDSSYPNASFPYTAVSAQSLTQSTQQMINNTAQIPNTRQVSTVTGTTFSTAAGPVTGVTATVSNVSGSTFSTAAIPVTEATANVSGSTIPTAAGPVTGVTASVSNVSGSTIPTAAGPVTGVTATVSNVSGSTIPTAAGPVTGVTASVSNVSGSTIPTVSGPVTGVTATVSNVSGSTIPTAAGPVTGVTATVSNVSGSTIPTAAGPVTGVTATVSNVSGSLIPTAAGPVAGITATVSNVTASNNSSAAGQMKGDTNTVSNVTGSTFFTAAGTYSISTAVHATSTKEMVTIPPKPITCAICSGPPEACEVAYFEDTCQPPNHYCINHVTNKASGERLVDRRCGNIHDCYQDWYLGSSDDDKCRQLSSDTTLTYNFECTYCCIKDRCNTDLHPEHNTLYMNV